MKRSNLIAYWGAVVLVVGVAGCTNSGTRPDGAAKPGSDDEIWACWDSILGARQAYMQLNLDLVEGLPADPSPQLGDGEQGSYDLDQLALAMNDYQPPDIVNMSDAASQAFDVLQNFDERFYENVVLYNPGLQYCSDLMTSLQQQDGSFGDSGGGGSGGGAMTSRPGRSFPQSVGEGGGFFSDADGDSAGTAPGLSNNCMATVQAVWMSTAAGQLNKSDGTTCTDYKYKDGDGKWHSNTGWVAAGAKLGPAAVAFGGERKPDCATKKCSGDVCNMSSPLVQSYTIRLDAKPYVVFVPEKVLTRPIDPMTKKPVWKWVDNPSAVPYTLFPKPNPNPTDHPIKMGPSCPQASEVTIKQNAEINIVYYIHGAAYQGQNGWLWGNDAFQAQADVDEYCFGPGTQSSAPGTFSIFPSEHKEVIKLHVMKMCDLKNGWQAGAATTMDGNGANVSFNATVHSTTGCSVNDNLDNFSTEGCTAIQGFGNNSFTTQPQNGALPIGTVYPFWNTHTGGAPALVGWMKMGMKLNGFQARATSTPASLSSWDREAGAVASYLTDRKKITDPPADQPPQMKLSIGVSDCVFLSKQMMAANPCKIFKGDFPYLPLNARDTEPTDGDLTAAWDKRVAAWKEWGANK